MKDTFEISKIDISTTVANDIEITIVRLINRSRIVYKKRDTFL